ncbi:MAG: hypothetical protein ABUL72_00775 [Armatimonadota bacterium]
MNYSQHFVGAVVDNKKFEYQEFLKVVFKGSLFNKCIFDHCVLSDCLVEDCEFQSVTFQATRFSELQTPSNRHTMFKNTMFFRCDMRQISCESNFFEKCSFIECRMKGIDLGYSRFSGCVFSSDLTEVEFYSKSKNDPFSVANDMSDCDFREAKLRNTEFFGVNLNPRLLPDDENIIVLWRGPEDLNDWQNAMAERGKNVSWIAQSMGADLGRPSFVYRNLFLKAFSQEEVNLLECIGKIER